MTQNTEEYTVHVNDIPEVEIKIHILGLRMWRFRLLLVTLLIRMIYFVSPKSVNVSLCDECISFNKEETNEQEQNP